MKTGWLTLLSAALALGACASRPMADTPIGTEESAGRALNRADTASLRGTGEKPQSGILSESQISGVLSMAHRTAENRARDRYRHPVETLRFFELNESQTVVEISTGRGWYTEILAPLLKQNGQYVAVMNNPEKAFNARAAGFDVAQNAEVNAKFKADPGLYRKVRTFLLDANAPAFGAPGSADLVLTFRNVHNWVEQGSDKTMFKAFFDILKPGGKLGLTEHRANPGTDSTVSALSGYVTEEFVIRLATEAGFKLAGKSEVNANPLDTKDHEDGVWSLPPTLALGEKDKARYLAIGESDRMTMVFVKP